MKNKKLFVISLLLLSLIFILTFTLTSASQEFPKGYAAFYPSKNSFCLDKDGEFLGCWCCPDGEECEIIDPTPGPKSTNTPREPKPSNTPGTEPSDTPEPKPSDTPMPSDPTSTPKAKKTKKPHCNCGGGNLGEGCNPNPNCDEKSNDKQDE